MRECLSERVHDWTTNPRAEPVLAESVMKQRSCDTQMPCVIEQYTFCSKPMTPTVFLQVSPTGVGKNTLINGMIICGVHGKILFVPQWWLRMQLRQGL